MAAAVLVALFAGCGVLRSEVSFPSVFATLQSESPQQIAEMMPDITPISLVSNGKREEVSKWIDEKKASKASRLTMTVDETDAESGDTWRTLFIMYRPSDEYKKPLYLPQVIVRDSNATLFLRFLLSLQHPSGLFLNLFH